MIKDYQDEKSEKKSEITKIDSENKYKKKSL
jgi:hypothetical protein